MHVEGFPPIARPDAEVLILGTMPGIASLERHQYYGHPRNAFWPIMADIHGFDAGMPYAARILRLQQARTAIWDVLKTCVRPGSLDASISSSGIVPNDFPAFLDTHPRIRLICFNGAASASLFKRHVSLDAYPARALTWITLPSTSPAHAALPFAAKLAAWRRAYGL